MESLPEWVGTLCEETKAFIGGADVNDHRLISGKAAQVWDILSGVKFDTDYTGEESTEYYVVVCKKVAQEGDFPMTIVVSQFMLAPKNRGKGYAEHFLKHLETLVSVKYQGCRVNIIMERVFNRGLHDMLFKHGYGALVTPVPDPDASLVSAQIWPGVFAKDTLVKTLEPPAIAQVE